MKFIKKFEDLGGPQVGDYVVCEDTVYGFELQNFTNSHVGRFIKEEDGFYIIKYENVPRNLKFDMTYANRNNSYSDVAIMNEGEIKYWSKDKEDCEAYLAAKKYNI